MPRRFPKWPRNSVRRKTLLRTICTRSRFVFIRPFYLLTCLFTSMFVEVNKSLFSSLGHRALGLSPGETPFLGEAVAQKRAQKHLFWSRPPARQVGVSAPPLWADPDCRSLRLLSRLCAPSLARRMRSRHARCFRPCGTNAPSLTGSAVGVFAADTLAARGISRPSAPCRWAACGVRPAFGGPGRIPGSANIRVVHPRRAETGRRP